MVVKNNEKNKLDEDISSEIFRKTYSSLQNFMLFFMFNEMCDVLAENKTNSDSIKMAVFKEWYNLIKKCNNLELENINKLLNYSISNKLAPSQADLLASTEDFQEEYNKALEEVKKIFFLSTHLK